MCPRFLSEPCIHPACVQAFLSQAGNQVSKPNFRVPRPPDHTVPLGEVLAMLACRSQESGPQTPWRLTVYSRKPARRPTALCGLPAPTPGNRTAPWCHPLPATQGILRPPCHSRNSAPLGHLNAFNPGSSPKVGNLKVQILRLILNGSLPKQAPSPPRFPQLCLPRVFPHLLGSKGWWLFYLQTCSFVLSDLRLLGCSE